MFTKAVVKGSTNTALAKITVTDMNIDPTMEIVYIPFSHLTQQAYPGIYLFTQPGRMIRPVFNLTYQCLEWIGPMEQVFMDIACTKKDLYENPKCK